MPRLAVFALLLVASPASAQWPTNDDLETRLPPSVAPVILPVNRPAAENFHVLAGVFNVLHIADIVTTSYDLTRPAAGLRATEGNPVLRGFSGSPVRLAVTSGALTIANMWLLDRVRRTRPKTATWCLAALTVMEMIVVTNNVRAAGQLQAARSGWQPPTR
jgi:hypothetical protein